MGLNLLLEGFELGNPLGEDENDFFLNELDFLSYSNDKPLFFVKTDKHFIPDFKIEGDPSEKTSYFYRRNQLTARNLFGNHRDVYEISILYGCDIWMIDMYLVNIEPNSLISIFSEA